MTAKIDIIGRYVLSSRVGTGSVSEVYRVAPPVSPGKGPDLVLQLFQNELGQEESFVHGLEREARVSRGLTHPNVLTLSDFGRRDGYVFFVREYFPHRSLFDLLTEFSARRKRLDLAALGAIAEQVCDALTFAHTYKDQITGQPKGVLHTGLQPKAVLLNARGMVKVTGFGIDPTVKTERPGRIDLCLGRTAYFSPAAFAGRPDAPGDLFSLGALLWECLTGEVLFYDPSPERTKANVLQQAVQHPSARQAAVPRSLGDFVLKLLERDPARRPASARDAKIELRKILTKLNLHAEANDLARILAGAFPAAAAGAPVTAAEPKPELIAPPPGADDFSRTGTRAFLKWTNDLEATQVNSKQSGAAPEATIRVEVGQKKKSVTQLPVAPISRAKALPEESGFRPPTFAIALAGVALLGLGYLALPRHEAAPPPPVATAAEIAASPPPVSPPSPAESPAPTTRKVYRVTGNEACQTLSDACLKAGFKADTQSDRDDFRIRCMQPLLHGKSVPNVVASAEDASSCFASRETARALASAEGKTLRPTINFKVPGNDSCQALAAQCIGAGYLRKNKNDRNFSRNCMQPLLHGRSVAGLTADVHEIEDCSQSRRGDPEPADMK